MCREPKFYVCKHCGNMVSMLHESGVKMICCGEESGKLTMAFGCLRRLKPIRTIFSNRCRRQTMAIRARDTICWKAFRSRFCWRWTL